MTDSQTPWRSESPITRHSVPVPLAEVSMANLDGKVAFITGAGSGIGQGTAERLAREGANICIAEIDLEGAEHTASTGREFGREALVVQCNVASQSQVQEAVAKCASTFGRL